MIIRVQFPGSKVKPVTATQAERVITRTAPLCLHFKLKRLSRQVSCCKFTQQLVLTARFIVFHSFNMFSYSLHNSLKTKCCFSHVRVAVLEAVTAGGFFATTLQTANTKAHNRLGKRIRGKAESTNVGTRRFSVTCEQNTINEAKM